MMSEFCWAVFAGRAFTMCMASTYQNTTMPRGQGCEGQKKCMLMPEMASSGSLSLCR